MAKYLGYIWPTQIGKNPMVGYDIPNKAGALVYIFRKKYSNGKCRYMCNKCYRKYRNTKEEYWLASILVKFNPDRSVEFDENPLDPAFHICDLDMYTNKPDIPNPEDRASTSITDFEEDDDLFGGIPYPDNIYAFQTYLFNADGVLWNSQGAIPGAAEFVNQLVDLEKKVFIITNNSTKTAAQFSAKLTEMGFEGIEQDNIITPLTVMVDYFKVFPKYVSKKVYIIGSEGIAKTLEEEFGVECFGMGPSPVPSTSSIPEFTPTNDEVSAVIVGFDPHFSYNKLMSAANYLSNRECGLFLMNEDHSRTVVDNDLIAPGSTCMTSSIRAAVFPREPVMFGRPSEEMREYLIHRMGEITDQILLFGTRNGSDLDFGRYLGVKTCEIETAESKSSPENESTADFVFSFDFE